MDDAEFAAIREAQHRAEVEKLESSFATGKDPNAALHALYLCLVDDMPVPVWVRDAFLRAYVKGLHGGLRTRSWNEVFGPPPRTKGQWKRFLRSINLPPKVWQLVAEAKDRHEPVDTGLFDRIGKKLGTNRDVIAKAYRYYCQLRGKP